MQTTRAREERDDTQQRVCLLPHQIPIAFNEFHDSQFGGHGRLKSVFMRMRKIVDWSTMWKEIKDLCLSCMLCQQFKPLKERQWSKALLSLGIMEVIVIDFVTPLLASKMGNNHTVVAVDLFSKFNWALAIPIASS